MKLSPTRIFQRILTGTADVVGLIVFVPLIELLRFLPEPASTWVAMRIVGALQIVMPRMRPVGRRNLELVFPEKSKEEREAILDKSFYYLARNLVTFAKTPKLDKQSAQKTMPYELGTELIRQTRVQSPNTGFIIASLHLGCFEQLCQIHSLLAGPASLLVRGFGLPWVDAYWNSRRAQFGNTVFSRKGGYQEVIRHLKAGKDVAMLYDQNVKRNHATFVDFFGIPAATTKALGYAVVRTGAPVVFCTSVELEPGRSLLIAELLPDYSKGEGTAEEKVHQVMDDLHRRTERVIREYPEQWFWIHRRFKTRPEGEAETMYPV